MADVEHDRFGIGGNQPPAPLTPVEVSRFLADTQAHLLRRRDELLAGVVRFRAAHPVIEDEETQGRAGDFAKQVQAAVKIAKDAFTQDKRPFIDGGKAVDAFYRGITEPLERGLQDVRAPMTAYALRIEEAERARRDAEAAAARAEALRLQEELRRQQVADEQRRQEERERARAEAAPPPAPEVTIEEAISASQAADKAARAAAARSADLSRTRGDGGSVNSLRETWRVEVVDLAQVPAEFLLFNERAAQQAVNRGLREIRGCRVVSSKHIQTR